MRKIFLFAAASALVTLFSMPALADTNLYVSYRDGYSRHQERPRKVVRVDHRNHHSRHYRPSYRHHVAAPVFWGPFYNPPRRTVVIEKTVVQPVVQYQYAPIHAVPVSGDFVSSSGQLCREYQSTGHVSGSSGSLYGTACLQPDGAWRVVD